MHPISRVWPHLKKCIKKWLKLFSCNQKNKTKTARAFEFDNKKVLSPLVKSSPKIYLEHSTLVLVKMWASTTSMAAFLLLSLPWLCPPFLLLLIAFWLDGDWEFWWLSLDTNDSISIAWRRIKKRMDTVNVISNRFILDAVSLVELD